MSEILPNSADGIPAKPAKLVFATLNVNGLPAFRQNSRTKALLLPYQVRHKELCRQLESSDIDVINFQEIFTHSDRRLFTEHLPSFGYSCFESSLFGPKGALVTFSRLPIEKVSYDSYFASSKSASRSGLPFLSLVKSASKGILVSRLKMLPFSIINTHPLANDDWDWSESNRFHDLQRAQLGELTVVVKKQTSEQGVEVLLGSDLNVAKDSELFRGFLGNSGLIDIFSGDRAPTFHQDFLESGQAPPCIDFILASGGLVVKKMQGNRMFQEKTTLENYGNVFLTDHQGLSATLNLS